MTTSRSALTKGLLIATMAAGTLMASSAAAESYVVCNRWGECWRVHERYTTYPSDARVVYHDDAWWKAHEHDSHWRILADPSDDHGWYDKDGVWHPFEHAAPPPP